MGSVWSRAAVCAAWARIRSWNRYRPGVGFVQQVGVEELVEQPAGVGQGGVEQGGGGVRVDVGAGVQAQQSVGALQVGAQVLVGQVQGGGDAALPGLQLAQPVLLVAQPLHQMQQAPGGVGSQPGGRDADRQRQPATQLDKLRHQVGWLVAESALADGLDEQAGCVRSGQGVQRQRVGVVEPGQPAPAGDQHQAARTAGQQRRHLGFGGGVVQQDQHLPVGEPGAVQRGPIIQAGRDLWPGNAERAQQVVERVGRLAGRHARGVAVQIDEQLPVRVAVGDLVRQVDGEGGLADPGHPVDRADHHRRRVMNLGPARPPRGYGR